MITYRIAKPEEYKDYVAFANLVFGSATNRDFDFAQLIPKVYAGPENAWMQHLAVDDERGIVGLIATLFCNVHVGSQTLRTGYLGTVSVHPQARSEGHMKQLMDMCLKHMHDENCDYALLGGLRQRYEYFGYVRGGVRYKLELSGANMRHALKHVDTADTRFVPIQPGDSYEVQAQLLHDQRLMHFDRSWTSFATICSSYHDHLYACVQGNVMIGYLITASTPELIQEFQATDNASADRMLKAWQIQQGLSRVTVVIPDWDRKTLCHLNTWAENTAMHYAHQVRILNYARTVEALLRLKATYTALEDGTMAFDAEGQRFTVCVSKQQVTVKEGAAEPIMLDCQAAGRLFAMPFPVEGAIPTPNGWFPLPFFAAEPDHF